MSLSASLLLDRAIETSVKAKTLQKEIMVILIKKITFSSLKL